MTHAALLRPGIHLQAAMLKKLAAEASAVLTSFWGSNRRQMLCTALIEHFLPLTVILACNGYMLTDPVSIHTTLCT